MAEVTDIQWCDSTVNPTMGCDGCELWSQREERCYAGLITKRYGGKSKGYPPNFATVMRFPGRMAKAAALSDLRGIARADKPWIPAALPRLIFISDMSDALSRAISFDYLRTEIVDVVRAWPHIGLWLTKRPARLAEFAQWLFWEQGCNTWPENLWIGTSITSQQTTSRITDLLNVKLGDSNITRFLSCEPLWSEIDLSPVLWQMPDPICADCPKDADCDCGFRTAKENGRTSIDWCILGGESGPNAKPCNLEWIRDGVKQCRDAGVPPFVKQLGTKPYWNSFMHGVTAHSQYLDYKDKKGGDMSEWPADLRIREFPTLCNSKN